MKMTADELQIEQLRNAAEAKAIYWYPGEFNGVRQWLEGVLLDITLMERRYVGELHSRRLRPDIVLEKRAPKYITAHCLLWRRKTTTRKKREAKLRVHHRN
jgi:hypothetical protein